MGGSRPPTAQLPLGISLAPRTSFDAFFTGPNGFAVELVRAIARGERQSQAYLAGDPGLGKSHLLQAACRAAGDHGRAAAYLPLEGVGGIPPDALEGLEHLALVCVDGVDAVAGDHAWEEALFGLINRAHSAGGALLFAGRCVPAGLATALPDLGSRLAWGPVVRLEPLSDAQKQRALTERARTLGIDLPPAVVDYLIRHYPRDLAGQLERLNRLDRAALAAGRRLTVPFVKQVLG